MLQLLIKKIQNHFNATSTQREKASMWAKDNPHQTKAFVSDIYLLIEYLDAARLFYYNNENAINRPVWFNQINELAQEIFNNQEFNEHYWKGNAVFARNVNAPVYPALENEQFEYAFNPVTIYSNYTSYSKRIENNQKKLAEYYKAIAEHLNQLKQKTDELNTQNSKIYENISLQQLIQYRKALEELLKEFGVSYEAEAWIKQSVYYLQTLSKFNTINKNISEEQKRIYENAKADNRNSTFSGTLNTANSTLAIGVLSAYIAGSIGTAFYFISLEYSKDLLRTQQMNDFSKHLMTGKDFGLTFANWLFFAWSIIDAIGVIVDGLNDAYNGDYGWATINILNGAQLITATLIGHYLYENATSTGLQYAGLALASGAFALCMFLCSYVAKLKELEATNFIDKLSGKSDSSFLYELSDVNDKNALIKKIDTIRRTRSDKKYSKILTRDLTIQQVKAILQTEALYQNKSKVSWKSCGITMSLVFTSSAIAAMGASEIAALTAIAGVITTGGVAAPIIATLIIIGVIINVIDRYQLRKAEELAKEITNDIVSDNGIKDSSGFYTKINSAYADKNTWSYWSNPLNGNGMARKLGIEKTEDKIEMVELTTKYRFST